MIKVFFVGMHNKKGMKPLDSKTASGKVIDEIIKKVSFECVKTNLCEVEYMPTDWLEINEFGILWGEKYSPKKSDIVVLLGRWVQENFFYSDCNILKVPHPAGIFGSRNKGEYIENVVNKIYAKNLSSSRV